MYRITTLPVVLYGPFKLKEERSLMVLRIGQCGRYTGTVGQQTGGSPTVRDFVMCTANHGQNDRKCKCVKLNERVVKCK